MVDALAALPTVKDNSAARFSPWRKQSGINGEVVEQGSVIRKVTVSKCGVVEMATGGDGERRGDGTLVRR